MVETNHMKLRTMIMVFSMIALPLAAVIGIKWPKFLFAEKSPSVPLTRRIEPTKPPAEPAPAWGATAPSSMATTTASPNTVIPAGGTSFANIPNNQVVPVANNDVRGSGSVPEQQTGRFMTSTGIHSNPGVVGQIILDEPDPNIRPLPTPFESPTPSDPFLTIQQRLRALGAIHYSLETWGTGAEAYRFQCRMSAGHNPGYSRHFEATDVDPLRVMQTVLDDVEAWKSGRLP